jgi:hypothetical protein
MKRLYLTVFAIAFSLGISMAQDEYDALRYSQHYFGGTTRVSSMAGAFGALGADFGSFSINPAGIGVFRSTEFTVTFAPSVDWTSARYLGNEIRDSKGQFALGNMGFVSTHKSGKESGFVSVSYAVGYNQLTTFNRHTIMEGRMPEVTPPVSTNGETPSSSYLDNFVNHANTDFTDKNDIENIPDYLDPFYEQLAWYADLIYYNDSSISFMNDINDMGYGQFQSQWIDEYGGIGEFVFGVGANFSDVFYIGATFGLHQLRFHQNISTFEEDDLDKNYYFNSFTFDEYLDVYGTGLTGKFGMIYRPVSFLRLGAAFHIPTFYWTREEFYTNIRGTFDQEESTNEMSPLNTFEYWLTTPYRAIGSVAFQVQKFLTVNVDYELADYSILKFDSDYPEDFMDVNQNMKNIYKLASNIRTGAEVVIKPLYLRAGFAFYGSPYETEVPGIDSYTLLYAGGLGFRSEKFFFDVGTTVRSHELTRNLYEEDDYGALISGNKANFMATFGFRF